jgi:phage protein D/phage baseplate assembly protein gpV
MNEKLILKIGSLPDLELSANVVELVVDTNVFMPGMFTIVVEDQVDPTTKTLKYTDSMKIKIGASIDIAVKVEDPADSFIPKMNTLIKGEITAIEPLFDSMGRVLLRIRGYDMAYRLTFGKKTRTYGDANPNGSGITEAEIIQSIVRDTGGLGTAKVDSSGLTSMRYSYVMQYNQSDWDFLWARAQLFGYQVYADGSTLNFVKADAIRTLIPPAALEWGKNLKKFEPRMIALGQVTEASAFGWDAGTKKGVTSSGTSDSSKTSAKNIGIGLTGSQSIKKAFFISPKEIVIEPMVRTAGQAKTIAGARFEKNQSQFIRASGELVLGDPYLVAGTRVKISGVGVTFAGSYYVTEARHIWNRDGYTVKFQVSGRNPYSIRHLLQGKEPVLNRINGVVVAKVTNLQDPEKLGRVQVSYPWMPKYNGADLSSNWARLAVSGGGKNRGIFFTPEVDDEVLVAFEHGDPSFPYIVGVLWNKMDKPPTGAGEILASGGKEVNQRVVRSRSGHTIIFDDTKGKEQIIIRDKTEKNSIVINSKDNSMTIKTEGDFTIEAGGKFTVKSKSDMSLASQAKAAIEAKSTIEVKGQSAAVKAGSSELGLKPSGAELKGLKVDVKASTQAAIQGSAMVQIQGGLVKIN